MITHSRLAAVWPFLIFMSAFWVCPHAGQAAPSAVSVAGQEDLSSPALAQALAMQAPPFVAETDDRPEFTRQLVRVQWRTLDPIDVFVVLPKGIPRPPVVIYLYSYPEDTHRFWDDAYCRRVVKNGCAAVGFDTALTGGRYHDRPMREWFVSELREALVKSAHDVQMTLRYLDTRSDLDMNKVGIFGRGSGATISVLAASADPRIKSLDLVSPWGDWPDWMQQSALVPPVERPRYVTQAFQNNIAALDPVELLPRLGARPLRLLWIRKDADVPPLCQHRMEAAAPKSAPVLAYDDNLAVHNNLGDGRLFQWISEQLHSLPQ